jgi:type II secretory pathway pseudopilin PulG
MIKYHPNIGKKAMVLLIVVAAIIIVSTLASVILSIILNQFRLTHHQTSRIQAYYADQAGMNYAIERLITGTWTVGRCTGSGCWWTFAVGDFQPNPLATNSVQIIFCPSGNTCLPATSPCNSPAGSFCINTTATYTWTGP